MAAAVARARVASLSLACLAAALACATATTPERPHIPGQFQSDLRWVVTKPTNSTQQGHIKSDAIANRAIFQHYASDGGDTGRTLTTLYRYDMQRLFSIVPPAFCSTRNVSTGTVDWWHWVSDEGGLAEYAGEETVLGMRADVWRSSGIVHGTTMTLAVDSRNVNVPLRFSVASVSSNTAFDMYYIGFAAVRLTEEDFAVPDFCPANPLGQGQGRQLAHAEDDARTAALAAHVSLAASEAAAALL
mmetsp:Transcript_25373/g.71212  ORF Transcript_25373/g.71212 Transcript_25373/m.71212 type:complete len:245 (+) Transcript_25373:75-809(+)